MSKVWYFVIIIVSTISFFGCDDPAKHQTSHPEDGGINLTIDWSTESSSKVETYNAHIVFASGTTMRFEGLSGVTNNFIVNPGEATIYVFNDADNINISGRKASIKNSGAGISPNSGLFYSWSGQVYTERDKDITETALMNRQTGELKISFAIKPASMIDKIKNVSAKIDGIASEIDLQTNELSEPSSVYTTLTKNSYYATTTMQLFGFILSAKQHIRIDVEFEGGYTRSATHELTSLIEGFNDSKNSLFTLNADMYISESSFTVDNWSRNTQSRYLSIYPTTINLTDGRSQDTIFVTTDQPSWVHSVIINNDWLDLTYDGNILVLSATDNYTPEERNATINISAGGLSESTTITQDKYVIEYYSDKEAVKIQGASVGKGVNIVLMGDGYTTDDMTKKTGKYELDMRLAAEHFFSVYPLSAYRDHFNVYMSTAISNEKGISNTTLNKTVDNRFNSTMEGGFSTGISSNVYAVVEYLDVIDELSDVPLDDITVLLQINENVYAGTCAMYYPMSISSGYGEGLSICMIPVYTPLFRELVVHEAAGHGFSKVTDEYIYYPSSSIPDEEKKQIIDFKKYGWFENVDFSDDINETSWSGFANNSDYSMVDTFEGASMYGKGIWRPEFNSCMNNNVLYFNAPTRWAQVRRIKRLAGIPYTFTQFLQDDVVPEYPSETRSELKNFIPLASPVIKELDKAKIRNR